MPDQETTNEQQDELASEDVEPIDGESEEANDDARQEMDAMMDQYLSRMSGALEPGMEVKVPMISVQKDHVLVDVGEKSEGVIALHELTDPSGELQFKPGDEIEAIVKGVDHESGLIHLSHTEARRRGAYRVIETAFKDQTPIEGTVSRVVKGGLIVDLGTTAFLPASQIDLRRVEDIESWVGQTVKCVVVEYQPQKRRIIVSRRRLLEEEQRKKREETFSRLEEGQLISARVKRIVDFGAFVDLGGFDGLVPRGEISWHRTANPDQYLKVDEELLVRVVQIDIEAGRITLSRRLALPDPWESADQKFAIGSEIEGEVVSLTNYGAFVRLGEGLDGMIHITDMAWDSGGRRPADYVAVGQKTRCSVLKVDLESRRISLGLKQLTADPWESIEERYPAMSKISGRVTGLTKYGAFVELEPGIEGMIHVSDFAWEKRISQPRDRLTKGDEIHACVLAIDRERRRISLGLKQLTENPVKRYSRTKKVGDVVEAPITRLTDFGAFVSLGEGVDGFIHVSQLDRERVESPAESFKVGDSITAEITNIDLDEGKVSLSRRQYLKKAEKKTTQKYMRDTTSGGTNLGELLAEITLEDDLPKE